MPVMYKAVEKGQPGVPGGGEKKHYASIVRDRKVELRTFIEEISEMNTLNTADVFAVLESFLQMSIRHLSEGRAIDMGQLGTFSPSIRSNGEETSKDVSRNSIKSFRINFRPSGILRDRLSVVKFEKISNGQHNTETTAEESE